MNKLLNHTMQTTENHANRRSILVFEWLCGGGLLQQGLHPEELSGLVAQGRAMLQAVCADFVATGADVHVPVDQRIPLEIGTKNYKMNGETPFQECLIELAKDADWVLLIAPESDGHLENCIHWLADCSTKLLNPDIEFTRLCSNKNRLQSLLSDHDIKVPAGCRADQWNDFGEKLPSSNGFVIKPNDGCGGEGIEFTKSLCAGTIPTKNSDTRIEEFVPGHAVSVSAIANLNAIELFPALQQTFDNQPIGNFHKCTDNLDPGIATRAKKLAEQTIAALPTTTGYFGIDMVIGARDVVIEVNPRITMSYPVLRDKLNVNMAELMLRCKRIEAPV